MATSAGSPGGWAARLVGVAGMGGTAGMAAVGGMPAKPRRWIVSESIPTYEVPSDAPTDPDADRLGVLEEEITLLAAQIHAATHRLLVLLAEFDRREGWRVAGHASCAHWLHFRTGIDLGAAREKVRAARALESLPRVSDSMSRGELSFSKVRALTRLADHLDDEQEEVLLDFARKVTAAELEKRVRGWRLGSRLDEAELERRRHASRTLAVFPGDDGMYVVTGRLDPEVGTLLMRALEAATDALHCPGPEWAPEGGRRGPVTREATPAQRRADAIGLLAERALSAGLVGDAVPVGSSRAERYQVILHVEPAALRDEGEAAAGSRPGPLVRPLSHLEDGTRVAAETSRRLCCDAAVVELRGGGTPSLGSADGIPAGSPVAGKVPEPSAWQARPPSSGPSLDLGRRTRTIPPALRRALETRDGGCRFPGCGLRFTEAHHIVHWADGGGTRLDNLLLLCRRHHRALHEDGFRVKLGADGRPRFFDRVGWPLPDVAPPLPRQEDPLGALRRRLEEGGGMPAPGAPSARYRRATDIPWELEARVLEAVEG
jgi:hypothetical protein